MNERRVTNLELNKRSE